MTLQVVHTSTQADQRLTNGLKKSRTGQVYKESVGSCRRVLHHVSFNCFSLLLDPRARLGGKVGMSAYEESEDNEAGILG